MSVIERDTITTLATVDISDGYGVELRQCRKRVDYTPEEAAALARELLQVAAEAKAAQEEDKAAARALSGGVRPVHGFDAAPVCRECQEGKHGACTGIALVDADDVEEHPCGCSRADHELIGGAA
ncbi:hypothetical protein [Microbacterium sp. NPDC058389]|uniref:hypothetical protein n=1 Tax=Microbacterium sp. NPDC058389 TaxID=3346475 RepID=UPI003658FD21